MHKFLYKWVLSLDTFIAVLFTCLSHDSIVVREDSLGCAIALAAMILCYLVYIYTGDAYSGWATRYHAILMTFQCDVLIIAGLGIATILGMHLVPDESLGVLSPLRAFFIFYTATSSVSTIFAINEFRKRRVAYRDKWEAFMVAWRDLVGNSFPYQVTQRLCSEVLPQQALWLPQVLTDEDRVTLCWDTQRYHLYIEVLEGKASWFALDLQTHTSQEGTLTFPIEPSLITWMARLKEDNL